MTENRVTHTGTYKHLTRPQRNERRENLIAISNDERDEMGL